MNRMLPVLTILICTASGLYSANTKDYEADVGKIYASDPDYAKNWPVEYHIRIMEGLLADFTGALAQLGPPYLDEFTIREKAVLLKKPDKPLTEGATLVSRSGETIRVGPDVFTPNVELIWGSPAEEHTIRGDVRRSKWALSEQIVVPAETMEKHWKGYLDQYELLNRMTVKVKLGTVTEAGVFDTTAALEFGGKEKDGTWRIDYGRANVVFRKTAEGWRMSRFAILYMTTEKRDRLMFDDVTSEWIAGLPENTQEFLTSRSASDELLKEDVAGRDVFRVQYLGETKPGVAVVDIDSDGWDDLFVWDLIGEAVLFRNSQLPSGKRGFVKVNDEYGLHQSNVSAAVFADLNNDEVLDLIIGRYFLPSEILFGYKGSDGSLSFFPALVNRRETLPPLVVAIAVADVNLDSYLDIYFVTADSGYHTRHLIRGDVSFDRRGPRNVLMVNLSNGEFSDLSERFGVEAYRSSLAATFADFNGDLYPDLVLANDLGPTTLYVNEKGDKFRDASKENGTDQLYFGMGTSFGDYDNDGDLDLYLTAMQSSAGARITSDDGNFATSMDDDSRSKRILASKGNALFRNEGGLFQDTSSIKSLSVVRGANWAWGAQFVDIDNDSFLDIYSPNGYFTYPVTERRSPVVRDY